ncbi:peptidyl-prolyl cis-trans isomerase-like 1 [Brassica napus]|uniref:peptidyl-prolyl cis-trans isomerase-like 1 n=1 Tax=Brassica napus TaxID=3708 RepID=UPI002078D547|nr:peptidyl-prolyl cis-trans isomerase-like 1 [Brassica napus]
MDRGDCDKHSPKTCRNFVELSRRGYYDNVLCHRIIKDFIVQGGDPTGTGRGGQSILSVTQLQAHHGQRLYGFVTGSEIQPSETLMAPTISDVSTPIPNPDHPLWFQKDQVVQAWLLGSLSDSIQHLVMHCSTAKEIWSTIEEHFNKPTNSRLFELQHKMQTV